MIVWLEPVVEAEPAEQPPSTTVLDVPPACARGCPTRLREAREGASMREEA